MAGNEIQTADSSEATEPAQASAKAKGRKAPKLNERGVPLTQWDNPDNDPNKRKHVGESPDGKGNELR